MDRPLTYKKEETRLNYNKPLRTRILKNIFEWLLLHLRMVIYFS